MQLTYVPIGIMCLCHVAYTQEDIRVHDHLQTHGVTLQSPGVTLQEAESELRLVTKLMIR